MIKLFFEKIYSTDRINEPCYVGLPLPKGEVTDINSIAILDSNNCVIPSQARATALWEDGSVKWLFIDFYTTILKNTSATYFIDLDCNSKYTFNSNLSYENNLLNNNNLSIRTYSENKLAEIGYKNDNSLLSMPILVDGKNNTYTSIIDKWSVEESNSLKKIIKAEGYHCLNSNKAYKFTVKLYSYLEKPYFEVRYAITNTTDTPLEIKSLTMDLERERPSNSADIGISNYRTRYTHSENGEAISKVIDAEFLKFESNEHFSEVFYGTFFGNVADNSNGISATIYQAQQNFPKAIDIENGKIKLSLVPSQTECVTMQSGMQREQRVLIYCHENADLSKINNISTIYQMPDRPSIEPSVFEDSKLYPPIFSHKPLPRLEEIMTAKADDHARCYGMMNWGDAPDMGYTNQGRGNGKLVWTNNEYDFPHACALQYARTGTRRYLDYVLVAGRHWMDVDICHYSNDELKINGQYEHSASHILGNSIVCSHEWVEGLLDYYHFTGDSEAYSCAIEIGKNVLRLLEQPIFKEEGETSARETGWALRTLVALYNETNDEMWLEKCEWIVGHFKHWQEKYGFWLSTYMDNVLVKVVFMVAVAIASLKRYYDICPNENTRATIKEMIIKEADDIIENSTIDCGLFYYKELPSLKRMGNNPLILEALAIAYELTGDKKYIEAGLPTLEFVSKRMPALYGSGQKKIIEDTVILGSNGTKGFAQIMLPFTTFYTTAARLGYLDK